MSTQSSPPIWTIFPFIGILLSITFFPWIFVNFWKKNSNKALVALGWSIPILFYYRTEISSLFHTFKDYISFISLIGSLFVICGGVFLRGDLRAKPSVNLCFLGVGALLANVIGTTGASMILVRSFLKTNSERANTWHLPLFFIFLVSNFGGLLTPLGDPPLFLGFLNGVPFHWTAFALFLPWALAVSILLVVFYLWDRWAYGRETPKSIALDESRIQPLRLKGKRNFIFLGGVVGAVFLPSPLREIVMILLAALSFYFTPKEYHRENLFGFHPILEVAALFAGIFITMTPVLQILEIRGSQLHLTKAWQYFWMSGSLSSFLDNAPTYLTFFHLAKSLHSGGGVAGVPEHLLKAISMGSVLMGANSYIGNGPNFMVKAIADEQGFKTLSFGAYLFMAILILFPIYFLLTWVFF